MADVLRDALVQAVEALDQAWAAQWDRYYGRGVTLPYAQSVSKQITEARNKGRAALSAVPGKEESTGTLIVCPSGCGGMLRSTDQFCPSCRYAPNEQRIKMDPQWCWEWFGSMQHRMKCRRHAGHAGEHHDHPDADVFNIGSFLGRQFNYIKDQSGFLIPVDPATQPGVASGSGQECAARIVLRKIIKALSTQGYLEWWSGWDGLADEAKKALSHPCHPALSREEAERTARNLNDQASFAETEDEVIKLIADAIQRVAGEDTRLMNWLEGEMEREAKGHRQSLFRQNRLITRDAIRAAIAEEEKCKL